IFLPMIIMAGKLHLVDALVLAGLAGDDGVTTFDPRGEHETLDRGTGTFISPGVFGWRQHTHVAFLAVNAQNRIIPAAAATATGRASFRILVGFGANCSASSSRCSAVEFRS